MGADTTPDPEAGVVPNSTHAAEVKPVPVAVTLSCHSSGRRPGTPQSRLALRGNRTPWSGWIERRNLYYL